MGVNEIFPEGFAIIGLIFVFWLIFKITKAIRPISKREKLQYEVNKYATGSDKERAYALGKSAKEATRKGGCVGWFWFFIILVIIFYFILGSR